MTVREIAEKLNADTRIGLIRSTPDMQAANLQIAFLLNAVVEERQKVIALDSWASWMNNNQRGPMPTMILGDYKDKALLELDLDKVWPVKER